MSKRRTELILIRRIQIGVLSHLALHLFALFFVIEQDEAIAQMSPLDFALRPLEQVEIALSGIWRRLAKRLELVGHFGAVTGADHIIIERHILPHGAR